MFNVWLEVPELSYVSPCFAMRIRHDSGQAVSGRFHYRLFDWQSLLSSQIPRPNSGAINHHGHPLGRQASSDCNALLRTGHSKLHLNFTSTRKYVQCNASVHLSFSADTRASFRLPIERFARSIMGWLQGNGFSSKQCCWFWSSHKNYVEQHKVDVRTNQAEGFWHVIPFPESSSMQARLQPVSVKEEQYAVAS